MNYQLKCQTRSGVKVTYVIANKPLYHLINDKISACICETHDSRKRDIDDLVLSKDEHICFSGNIREEGLILLRTGTHSYKVVSPGYVKKHKPKSERSIIRGQDLVSLLSQYNRYGQGSFRRDRKNKSK